LAEGNIELNENSVSETSLRVKGRIMKQETTAAAFRPARYLARDVAVVSAGDGSLLVSNRVAPPPAPQSLPQLLADQARSFPERPWLAQRNPGDEIWQTVTYGEAKHIVDALTQGLLNLRLKRPVLAVLSGNTIEHALIAMAALQAHVTVVPVSPAYATGGGDFAKLRNLIAMAEPGIVFVQHRAPHARALAALGLDVPVVSADLPAELEDGIAFTSLAATAVTPQVAASIAAITPDTVAKLMFTSGSTGSPKAVIHTQRVLCQNIAMLDLCNPRPINDTPPVLLDWLPWSHVMGGNAVFNGVLAEGGTLYIDGGRPAPGLFDETIRNLLTIAPTRFVNVPVGFAMLVDALERDAQLAGNFFRNLISLGYAGARLPDDICNRLEAIAVRETGCRIAFVTGYGSTEMGPAGTNVYWPTDRVGLIGLPAPAVTMKLCPLDGDRYEIRLKSPGMFAGYHGHPDQTAVALDEDGFYRTGDAARYVDPADATQGFAFAGRIAEDFKLLSGTFIRVGELRLDILEACPALADLVIAAPDMPWLGLLAWLKPGQKRDEAVAQLTAYNQRNTQSSRAIRRLLLLDTPPSVAAGEITDKGYVNQRGVLSRRAAAVSLLYAEAPAPDVVLLPG
jgi:feruloyl-CoA synthase